MAQSLQSVWIVLFKEAQHERGVEPGCNPAQTTKKALKRTESGIVPGSFFRLKKPLRTQPAVHQHRLDLRIVPTPRAIKFS
jgi:hypothetical protein